MTGIPITARRSGVMINFGVMVLLAVAIVVNGFSPLGVIAAILLLVLVYVSLYQGVSPAPVEEAVAGTFSSQTRETANDVETVENESLPDRVNPFESPLPPLEFTVYRRLEKQRAIAALLAGGSILLAGAEGTGKTVVANAVVEELKNQGFDVAFIEPASPKLWLLSLAEQLGVEVTDIAGKSLTIDGLKEAIAVDLRGRTAFLAIEDAHQVEAKLRIWLKHLKRSRQPMLLIATDPPRTDIFLNTPPLILQALPEHCIRDLMEKTAIHYGIPLHPRDFSRLQAQAGGNPMLAIRSIEQEYLGLSVESSDEARHYFDITPLLFLATAVLMMLRLVALGTHNPIMYVLFGSAGVMMLGLSKLFQALPKDSKRIT